MPEKELLAVIDRITKYGLSPNVKTGDKIHDLEKNLVALYAKYFEIASQEPTDSEKECAIRKLYPHVVTNVRSNFQELGWYHVVLNPLEVISEPENAVGDAEDDLSDIIYDLLEVKWLSENDCDQNALWFFKFIFKAHTRDHLIDLLSLLVAVQER